jgi:hypothetical protein
MPQAKVIERIFDFKRGSKEWRTLHNEELHNFFLLT